MHDHHRTRHILDLCLRVGEILLSNGSGAAEVTNSMETLARHFGLHHVESDVTFTSLSMAFQATPNDESVVLMRRVKHRAIDYEDLTYVHRLVRDILADRIDLTDARARTARIAGWSTRTPAWVISLAWGVMCAGVALMLGGGLTVIAIASATGVLIDQLKNRLERRHLPTFYLQIVGGLVATLAAVGAVTVGLDIDPSLAVTANIIMLLSGIGLVGAIHDALSGFLVTSAARMIEVFLATAGIIAGVSGGLSVARIVGADIERLVPGRAIALDALPLMALGAGLASAAFAVACHSPKRVVVPIFAVAALGTAITQAMGVLGFGRSWSVGMAALSIGLISRAVSRWTNVPALIVLVSSIVPLLPGLAIYRGLALLGAESGDAAPVQGILALVTAGSIAVALAAGVILGDHLATPLAPGVLRMEDHMFAVAAHARPTNVSFIIPAAMRRSPRSPARPQRTTSTTGTVPHAGRRGRGSRG